MATVDFNLYLITDRRQVPGGDLCGAVEAALRGGVRAVQLREKDLTARELFELALKLREITGHFGARLLVNDRVDVALAVRADGVHLGEAALPPAKVRELAGDRMLVGVSCHGLESALAAAAAGADFITFGPVYATPSKARYGEPVGLERLREATGCLRIPVFALGGVNAGRVGEVLERGARGIALISAILAAQDPETAARELLACLSPGGLT